MKNLRNVALALIIPFGAAALAFAASSIVLREVEVDISDIDWDYRDMEGYSLRYGREPLYASQVYNQNYVLSEGNDLVWEVTNTDEAKPVGEIQYEGGQYYFNPLSVGQCTVVCSNEKGTVNRSFTAVVYATGAILANPVNETSGRSITGIYRYGTHEYSWNGGEASKVTAGADFEIDVIGDAGGTSNLKVESKSDNIDSIVLDDGICYIEFAGTGIATFTLVDTAYSEEDVNPLTYSFEIVDGVNIYDYQDLMEATNRSETGENVILWTNFGSLGDIYELDAETGRPILEDGEPVPLESSRKAVALFGEYDPDEDTFSFAEDCYAFDATLESPFIESWNDHGTAIKRTYSGYEEYDTTLYAGIHLKGDMYGNGFSLNLHNLTFPYELQVRTDEEGNSYSVYALREDNLFRGPLTYFAYGDPHLDTSPMVASYGQDNAGIFIDTDGVTISDTQIYNCDLGNNFENLRYTGTAVDVEASGVTIVDSIVGNGRTAVRAYSAPDLTIDNSLLQNGYEYLLSVGSNNLAALDTSRTASYVSPDSEVPSVSNVNVRSFENRVGDEIYNSYLTKDAKLSDIFTLNIDSLIEGEYSNLSASSMSSVLKATTTFYDSSEQFEDRQGNIQNDTTVTVNNTMFYRSGIASINLENALNGPYLYLSKPSLFTNLMTLVKTVNTNLIINPLYESNSSYASDLGRTMQPSSVTVTGDTRFYDWKDEDDLSFSSSFQANMALLTEKVPALSGTGFDDYYPLADTLTEGIAESGWDRSDSVNIPVLKSGGSINRSTISFDEGAGAGLSSLQDADLTDHILTRDFASMWDTKGAYSTVNLIAHCLTAFTGFEPYEYISATGAYQYDVDDVPVLSILQGRNK